MQPKYRSKVKLSYIDTDSFIYEIKIEDFYKDIPKDVEIKFDTRGYSKNENRPLPVQKNKRAVINMMKNELGVKVMKKIVAVRAKMYACSKLNKKVEDEHCNGTKKCEVAESPTFDDYED